MSKLTVKVNGEIANSLYPTKIFSNTSKPRCNLVVCDLVVFFQSILLLTYDHSSVEKG